MSVKFTDDSEIFGDDVDRAPAGTMRYTKSTCELDYNFSFIVINKTPQFMRAETGPAKTFFVTKSSNNYENIVAAINSGGRLFSFYEVMLHEIGHMLGLEHLFEEHGWRSRPGCETRYWNCEDEDSRMNNTARLADGTTRGLTDYDKCYFAKIYCPGFVPVHELNVDENESKAYPNPTEAQLNIEFEVTATYSPVSLYIVDLLGRIQINVINQDIYYQGIHNIDLDLSSLSKGTYICYLKIGGKLHTEKIIIGSN